MSQDTIESPSVEKEEKLSSTETSSTEAKKTVKKSSKKSKSVPEGMIYIFASFNNTIVTITDMQGNVISASSSGASGFKGSRKSTAYAAQVAAENAMEKAKNYGLQTVHIRIKGVGAGREQAIRGIQSKDTDIISIIDTTPVPHNGCRKKKARRI